MAPSDQSRRPASLVVPVGAVAAVMLIGTLLTASVVAINEDDGAGRRTDPGTSATVLTAPSDTVRPAFPDAIVLYGDRADNAALDVPSGVDDWERTSIYDSISWKDENGDDFAVLGPVIYAYASCPKPESSALGYAVFYSPIPDAGQGADVIGRRILSSLLDAEARAEKGRPPGERSKISEEPYTLPDGTEAVLLRGTASSSAPGPCDAPLNELSLLTFDSGAYYTSALVGRSLEYPTAYQPKDTRRFPLIDEEQRDRIIGSVRLLSPPTAKPAGTPSHSESPTGSPSESDAGQGDGSS